MSESAAQEPVQHKSATLVLISRTGEGIPDDEELARICAGREIEVLLAVAPWRPSIHTRANRGHAGVPAVARPGAT